MKRGVAGLAVLLAVLASAGTGTGAWLLTRDRGPQQPEISAYANGHLTRVGPYLYCNVLNLNECALTEARGTLAVDERHPIQLSVDTLISQAPWQLIRVYDDPVDTTGQTFQPGSTIAVTIPTVDPHRGPLRGLVVQLPTLVIDRDTGETFPVPHAEWAVGLLWNRSDA